MKKIYFLILSAFVGFLFMQSCKEDENIDGCKFIDYTFYVEFVNSEGNPVVTQEMNPTAFSIRSIDPWQEASNFSSPSVFKGENGRYYARFDYSVVEFFDDNHNFKFEVSSELWQEPIVFYSEWIVKDNGNYKEGELKNITVNNVEHEILTPKEYAKEDRNPRLSEPFAIELVRVVVDQQP